MVTLRNLDLERQGIYACMRVKTRHRVKNLGSETVSGTHGKCWRSSEEGEYTEGQYGGIFWKELGSDVFPHGKPF